MQDYIFDGWTIELSGSQGQIQYPIKARAIANFRNAEDTEAAISSISIEEDIANGNLTLDQIFTAARNRIVQRLQAQGSGGHTVTNGTI